MGTLGSSMFRLFLELLEDSFLEIACIYYYKERNAISGP